MGAPVSPTSSAPSPAAPPVAPVAPAPRVKLEGSGTASVTAPSLPSVSRSSATPALTLADLERVLELRDNRLAFAQAERDVKLGKLVSYSVAKPFPEPSYELFRRLHVSSSIDELIAALEKEIVGGPHPAVAASEQQADAFAARARADLLEHELRETMKLVSQLEESEKTASALVRSLKEQVAELENRNISLQELHQSTNLERDSWSTERFRLDATIRDKERIIASMTADYHRDAGNRQLVLGRCYELTAQVRQLSDAVAMGNTSAHQLLKRQLADKDNEIRRLLRTIRMSPVVSEFQRRSPFLRRHSPDSDADSSGSALTSGHASSRSSTSSRSRKKARATPTPPPVSSEKSSSKRSTNKKAAKSRTAVLHSPSEGSDDEAGLAPLHRPRRTTAANCSAIQRRLHAGESDSDSEVLGEAAAISSSSGHGRQASSRSAAVSSTSAPPPSSQVTSPSPTQAPPGSIVDLASANASVSSSALAEDLEGADSSGGESSSTTKQTEAASTLACLSGATNKAKAVVPARSAKDASKPKPASKAKSTGAIRSAKDGSEPKSASIPSAGKVKLAASDTKARAKSDGGVPPHHVDVKVLVARAAASARLDSRESGPMKRLWELPFFHKGSKRCWEKIMSSCAVSVTMEKTADGERTKPTPCNIAGLAAFMDVDDSGHPWRSVLRLLPHSLFFVDDSVLEVCPPVEKGKRSKKPGSLLEVLSYEWCTSRGVVREDILLALWERMHWIVESSVNVRLAEAFLASERTSRIDYEFTSLWKSLKGYFLGQKQRSDLLRLTVKVLGDAVVGAANHKIDGLPAPLVNTEVCFDPAIPFCPPVNLPWFPRTAD
ncbi:unnamed protein product [Phytophthora fragariaefolia]|uniref:Unnamed protein product n=1 Tax=Phytophthora fragariaefolia TaxID=1490495 RepID=A0A9W6TUV8_9STRA|nr:unnamed protein product [Phytophthora fragariaefolia]